MTAAKKGDRVRVAFEGTIDDRCSLKSSRDFHVAIEGDVFCIPKSATVEILRPPVKVGDVIETAEELDALPWYAVVRENKTVCRVWEKWDDGGWRAVNPPTHRPTLPATVIYLPDGAA